MGIIFQYNIGDIRLEVEKRSSYLGAMRSNNKQQLLERISLTEGENFLFYEYLKEATAETYDWIQAFGRGDENGYRIFLNGQTHTLYENCGTGIEHEGKKYGKRYIYYLHDDDYTIDVENQTMNVVNIDLSYDDPISINLGHASKYKLKVTAKIIKGYHDNPFEDIEDKELLNTERNSNTDIIHYSFREAIQLNELGALSIKKIEYLLIEVYDIEPSGGLVISENDYIKFIDISDEEKLYYALSEIHTDNVFSPNDFLDKLDLLEDDYRNKVIYKLDCPDWQDSSMYKVVDNRLREALVNYILYRWFEMVYPDESEKYFNQWEKKSHDAQMALNREHTILKRAYKTF